MSDQTDSFVPLVKPYGLSDSESRLYVFLLQHGFSTALLLSRQLKMGRTKVYRLLDTLKAKQLVEFKVDERGMRFGATHPSKFQQLVTQEEQRVEGLRESLPDLMQHLQGLMANAGSESKVLYYEGEEGLKQVSYNITRAKNELRVFEMEHLSDFTPPEFAEKIRQELVANHIFTRDLTNKQSFDDHTQVSQLITTYSAARYIPADQLKIRFEVLVYNDVYATYSYQDGKPFCVEIYNQQLADMQKQLFDFVWQHAQPLEYTSKRGAARLPLNRAPKK